VARKPREAAGVVKERIERAAMRLFALRGSGAVSVAHVAAEIGMSRQAVLYHYKTKQALRDAVITRALDAGQGWFLQFLDTGGTPAFDLESLTSHFMARYEQDPFVAGVILREIVEDPDEAGGRFQAESLPWRSNLNQLIEAAKDSGVVRADVDTDHWFDRTALMLVTTLALPPRSEPPVADSVEGQMLRRQVREAIRIALTSVLVDPSGWLTAP